MTQKEWLTSSEPQAMLEFLQKSKTASNRKLRLFAVACSRRIWPWIDALGRTAVEVAEVFADGSAGSQELRAARLACQGAGDKAAWYAAASNPLIAARNAARSAQAGVAKNGLLNSERAELLAQADLLREIFDNSFRHSSVDKSWLTLEVVKLAQTMYDDRDFTRMAALADDLEKARCQDDEILDHCRGGAQHVRGCWVVDLLLGKD